MAKGKGATIPTGDREGVPKVVTASSQIRLKGNLRDLYPITAYKVIQRGLLLRFCRQRDPNGS